MGSIFECVPERTDARPRLFYSCELVAVRIITGLGKEKPAEGCSEIV